MADFGNHTVRKVTPAGVVTTIAGIAGAPGSSDGALGAGQLYGPAGVAVDSSGNVYVADAGNDMIRRVSTNGYLSTIAGAAGSPEDVDGLPGNARFDSPGRSHGGQRGRRLRRRRAATAPSGALFRARSSRPRSSAEPASQAVDIGSSATFSVGVPGTPPFSYQWYFNGAAIGGATGASYTVVDAQQSEAGSYTVAVANSQGTVTSAPAVLDGRRFRRAIPTSPASRRTPR